MGGRRCLLWSTDIDFHDGSSYSDESAERRRQARAGVNVERAAELNKMIDSGDWTGVVAAANRFSGEDDQAVARVEKVRTSKLVLVASTARI